MPVEKNKLIVILNPFNQSERRISTIDYDPTRTLIELVSLSGVAEYNPTVVKNGRTVDPGEMFLPLMPGDMVHVMPTPQKDGDLRSIGMLAAAVIAYYYIGPAASGYIEGLGVSATAAEAWGAVAATAFVTASGMLINGNLPKPVQTIRGNTRESSPTYGWSVGDNTVQEGVAIPVIYGNEATYPQIINQWLECTDMYGTDATHDQWWHVLLSVAEDQTNTVPTAEEIKLGDMPLTSLDANSYSLETTDGSATGDVLTNHEKLHQVVPIGKELNITSVSQILLHMNGNDGSSDIVEDGVGTGGNYKIPGETGSLNTWTCVASTALSTDHPFIGSANLEITTGYLSVDNWRSMALWTQDTWDFECRFRQATLADCCIAGQMWIESGITLYFWSICYNSAGNIIYQQILHDISGASYTVFINLSGAASLSIDTWHHIRVARSSNTIYIFLDGVLLTSGNFAVTPEYAAGAIQDTGTLNIGDTYYIEDCDFGHFYDRSDIGETFTAEEATSLDSNNTVRDIDDGYYLQGLGFGYYYNGAVESLRQSTPMELDEVRLRFHELIYDDLVSYTPPTNAIADENEQIYFTKGAIDGFWVNLLCPYGLYYQNVDGLDSAAVETWISWRQVGSTTWERQFFGFFEFGRDPLMFQRYFTPAAGRGNYEIRVTRIIWPWAVGQDANKFQVTCMLSSIDEVLNEALRYPYLQLVSLDLKAQEKLSGRPPAIRIESNRTSITVPNYNGIGTQTVDPRNNAYATFDAMTNRIYGIGLDSKRIIEADWEDWADWCNGLVGGNSRCQLNMAFDASYSFDEALQHIESCGRARVVNRGSKITAVIDQPASATDLFCNENIAPGTEKLLWLRQAEKSDGVEIAYRNAAKDFEEDSEFYPGTNYYSLTRVPRVTRINMLGIKSQEQARREAILRQQISESIKRSLSLQSGFESLKVRAGDVIDYASKGNIMAFTGRLARGSSREEQYFGTVAYLDKEITLDSATYSGNCIMIVRASDDTITQYTVTGPFDEATWFVILSSSGTWDFLAPWIIGRPTEKYKYKVSLVSRGSAKDALIESQTYDETAYYHADYDSGGTAI